MIRPFTLLLCLGALAASVDAKNKTYTYPMNQPIVAFDIPESWTVMPDPEDPLGLIAYSPDEEIEIDIWPVEAANYGTSAEKAAKAAADDVVNLIGDWVENFELDSREEGFDAGIAWDEICGWGDYVEDGSEIQVCAMFMAPNDQSLFVMMYWGSGAAYEKNAKAIDAIYESVRAQ